MRAKFHDSIYYILEDMLNKDEDQRPDFIKLDEMLRTNTRGI